MKIALVVAYDRNRVIGYQGKMPWHLPEDLKRFKKLTLDHTVIMGRKTFESIGHPLPRRRNIVVTRQADYSVKGIETVSSLQAAFDLCQQEERVFVIGGAEIFSQALDQAHEIFLTEVDGSFPGDAFFPQWNKSRWQITSQERGENCQYINYSKLHQSTEGF